MIDGENLLEHVSRNKQVIKFIFYIFLIFNAGLTILVGCFVFNCDVNALTNIHITLSTIAVILFITLYLTYKVSIDIKHHTDLEELAKNFNTRPIPSQFETAIKIISKINFNLPQFKRHIKKD